VTRNWVLALDIAHNHSANTQVRGQYLDGRPVHADSRSSRALYLAPAVEYNFNGNVGIIVGARVMPDGRNTTQTVTPVAAINMVY
jgi:hypothetical protein